MVSGVRVPIANTVPDLNDMPATSAIQQTPSEGDLLAVDIGLRSGLALYGRDGRLRWYRSENFVDRRRLRQGVNALLRGTPSIRWLIIEGGGPLADIWEHAAARHGIELERVSAERWREALLYAREQRSGKEAKSNAASLARRVIEWSDARRPTSLRHDAAEAVLVGFWWVLQRRWIPEIPAALKRAGTTGAASTHRGSE